jgi:hypothetical protein
MTDGFEQGFLSLAYIISNKSISPILAPNYSRLPMKFILSLANHRLIVSQEMICHRYPSIALNG